MSSGSGKSSSSMRFITAAPSSGMSGIQTRLFTCSLCTAKTPREPKNIVTLEPLRNSESAVIRALKTWQSSSWKHMMDTFLEGFMVLPPFWPV